MPRSTRVAGSHHDTWTAPDPPVDIARPMLFQAWRRCAFLHWSVDPAAVRPLVPRAFDLDLLDGRAWVGLVSFEITHMNPGRRLPPVPGLRRASESHVRTYVRGPDGRRGIWMLSLDMAPPQAAAVGRALWFPYWWADMELSGGTDMVRYRSRRRAPNAARLRLDLEIGEEIPWTELTASDDFVTARWVLYTGVGPMAAAFLVEHPRWRFRRTSVLALEQTLTERAGLPAVGPPDAVHYSDGVDAVLAWPRIHVANRARR